jgi:hypothetical protein
VRNANDDDDGGDPSQGGPGRHRHKDFGTNAMNKIYLLAASALLGLGFAAAPRVASAAASHDNCTGFVDTPGTVITTPGTWCLRQDLEASDASVHAITIAADDVVLDCGDRHVRFVGAVNTTSDGIHAEEHHSITVRNCRVSGFRYGIMVFGAATATHSNVVEDNVVTDITVIGIRVDGDQSVARRNRISRVISPVVNRAVYGIVGAYGVAIEDNTIQHLIGQSGSVWGIFVSQGKGNLVRGNQLRDLDGNGNVVGMIFEGGYRATVTDNVMVNRYSSQAFWCFNDEFDVRIGDNVIAGFAIPFAEGDGAFCGDLGTNDITY